MTILAQKRDELKLKRDRLHDIFVEAGTDIDLAKVTSLEGDTHAKADEIKRLNTELNVLGEEVEELALVERVAADVKVQGKQGASGLGHTGSEQGSEKPVVKSLGDLFVESAAYTQRQGGHGPRADVDVDVKTLMTTAAGWLPQSLRSPGYLESAQYQPMIVDVIPGNTTTQAAIVYMVETTFTNNAAARAEGANNAGEAALALTPTTAAVAEFAVWIPVTAEQMEDVPFIRQYVNNRLTLMLRQTVDAALMTGGGSPSVTGLIGMANVNTQAKGADPTMDAIHKGMTLVEVTGRAQPSATLMHPNDWEAIRLTRTADGIYILGNPGENGPKRLWSLPVVTSTGVTENTAVVGDFQNFCEVVTRQGITFEYTDSHASLFIQRTRAILAFIRLAFPVYRPAAFTQVTGI